MVIRFIKAVVLLKKLRICIRWRPLKGPNILFYPIIRNIDEYLDDGPNSTISILQKYTFVFELFCIFAVLITN